MTSANHSSPGPLGGSRVLLVGASAGIGRALAVRLVDAGARVVVAARRMTELEKTVAEAAGGHPVRVDVRDEADCGRLARETADRLGQVDFLISCAGAARLRPIAETSLADWQWAMETNTVGFHHVLRACLPFLAPHALAAALSSEAVGQPRAALGAYATSKVALERTLQAWQAEHPELRICRIRVGQTAPTDFGSDFDDEALGAAFESWAAQGLLVDRYMSPDEVAGALVGMLAVAAAFPSVNVEELTVTPSAAAASFSESAPVAAPSAAAPSD
ncbi:SDR family NAD(P)-dependent oxidoreductase [Streptomyces sp. WMMC500]|uniref:SDR family oxidoreductase n=1 Tax=Streptomyces sp. WMMC500 TaxID=3015154 RepID=UPI00248CA601|nr:SDR family oxidoreductase [Streptomyces sp. WMMC500]WBB61269.1 SDR family NAD(P)-dependent oxidoreductase [Streptomyces sp. WMMC500]